MPADTIPSRLFEQARRRPEAPAWFAKVDGRWQGARWRDHVREVRRAARALIALGLDAGATVAILGYNRPEWVTMDLAAMCIGGAPAGIYTTCSAEEVGYIIHHAGAAVALVENEAQWAKIRERRAHLPGLRLVVLMKGAPRVDDPLVTSWEEFLATGDDVDEARVDERVAALEPAGLATLIYTSGTTGPPKGVMLTHRNLAWTAGISGTLVDGSSDDVALSYLPLSHIAEQMLSIHGPVTQGSCIYFAEGLEKVPDNLKEVQPTYFFGVPRIWEKLHAGISGKLTLATGIKRALADWAQRVGREANALRNEAKPLPARLAVEYRLADRLVFSKVKAAIGLGRARMCVSGAAPVGREVLEFFSGLDIPIHEVYGQSEDTGPTSFNFRGRTRLGTVGQALPGVDVQIADDGEIRVRGPNVFPGYFKDPAATAEALDGEWLRSGDLGALDADGYLTITGRKKEILITSGGKNITPRNIEEALQNHELVAEVVVVGDRRHYLTALVTLDPAAAARFLQGLGTQGSHGDAGAHAHPAVRDALQKAVDEVNSRLARVETIKKFAILPRAFSIESGELTPTLKIKRRAVYTNFAPEIEAMYTE